LTPHGQERAPTGARPAGDHTPKPPWPAWIIFHVPHASTVVPAHARAGILLSDAELEIELARLTDHGTDVLLVPPEAKRQEIAATVSRFVVDVERFLDDKLEPMAKVGMGAIYTRTTDGRPFRRPLSPDEKRELLDRYYHPHHQRLTEAVDDALAKHDRALILDLHSFPHRPLPCDLDQNPARPDICLGTDTLHTPLELVEALTESLSEAGYSVEVDRPYSGAIVPTLHYGQDLRVATIMIEINRRLYLEAGSAVMSPIAHRVGQSIQASLSHAVGHWATAEQQTGLAP